MQGNREYIHIRDRMPAAGGDHGPLARSDELRPHPGRKIQLSKIRFRLSTDPTGSPIPLIPMSDKTHPASQIPGVNGRKSPVG